jgi:hypothetical protein
MQGYIVAKLLFARELSDLRAAVEAPDAPPLVAVAEPLALAPSPSGPRTRSLASARATSSCEAVALSSVTRRVNPARTLIAFSSHDIQ